MKRNARSVRTRLQRVLLLASLVLPVVTTEVRADVSAAEELEELRVLEARVVDTIATAKEAFVFIEGGSGFLISADGYVLTNNHVVGGRNELVVQLVGGRNFPARLIGRDPRGDVALLKIDGGEEAFPHLELGDSDALRVGQQVIALGDPFLVASLNLFFGRPPPDHDPSASLGVVSALHRYSDTYSDAIQVDTAVNRGNSGGPLLTLDGKAVGINGKIETRFAVGINSGVGYAVPSNQVKNFLDPLKEANGGVVNHGFIAGLNVGERYGEDGTLEITRVDPGSTADQAGFRTGDRIVSVDGYEVPTRNRYKGAVSTHPVGAEIPVRIVRGSEGLELKAPIEPLKRAWIGIGMEDGPKGGVLVTRVMSGSPAANAGIEKGDVLLFVQGRRTANVRALRQLLRGFWPGDEVEVGIVRGEKLLGVRIQLGMEGQDIEPADAAEDAEEPSESEEPGVEEPEPAPSQEEAPAPAP